MDDDNIVARIGELSDEEYRLERSHGGEPMSRSERDRPRAIEVSPDQRWDRLRQRRARRSAGRDPDQASVSAASVVEGYRQ